MILALVKRHLKCYFRDTLSVFFSMLGVIIIIGLYLLFLGEVYVGGMSASVGENARFMMDSWIMGGVVAASTLTTTLGAFGIMVTDQEKKIMRDFKSSPIPRWKLVASYVISTLVIGLMMSLLTLGLAELYISIDGTFLSFFAFIKVLGIIVISVLASSSMVFFLIIFLKSSNALTAISIVIGTVVGFLTGIYIPIGKLDGPIQTVIKIFPTSHSAVLLRQVMMNEAIPLENLPTEIKLFLGANFEVNGTMMTTGMHLLVIILTIVVFLGASILVVSKRKEKE